MKEFGAYNLMVTDGHRIFGTRYSTHPEKVTPTLYVTTASRFEFQGKDNRLRRQDGDDEVRAVLITSEKLTEFEDEWIAIPPNYCIVVHPSLEIELFALK